MERGNREGEGRERGGEGGRKEGGRNVLDSM